MGWLRAAPAVPRDIARRHPLGLLASLPTRAPAGARAASGFAACGSPAEAAAVGLVLEEDFVTPAEEAALVALADARSAPASAQLLDSAE